MRLLPVLAVALLLSACPVSKPRSQADDGAHPGSNDLAAQPKHLVIAFAATESDPWDSEMITAIGAGFGFDPWAAYTQSGHLDVYGPLSGKLGERRVEVTIALAGLSGVSDLLAQQALGEEMRLWIESQQPDLVWLDGDQLQMFCGRAMPPELPVMFTGTVGDRELYYQPERDVTGIQKRHSLPGVMKQIWQLSPDAKDIALVSDTGVYSQNQLMVFKQQLELVYNKGSEARTQPPVKTWSELQAAIQTLAKVADAVVVCGLGGETGAPEFEATACPENLLDGISKPVVTLGPSPMDHSGAIVVSLMPAEHVRFALATAQSILSGQSARTILPITPPEMEVFFSEARAAGDQTVEEPEPAN